jgi:hypothetical protein
MRGRAHHTAAAALALLRRPLGEALEEAVAALEAEHVDAMATLWRLETALQALHRLAPSLARVRSGGPAMSPPLLPSVETTTARIKALERRLAYTPSARDQREIRQELALLIQNLPPATPSPRSRLAAPPSRPVEAPPAPAGGQAPPPALDVVWDGARGRAGLSLSSVDREDR